MDEMIENKIFSEIEVGDCAYVSQYLTLKDVQLFALTSGDANPVNIDEEYVRSDLSHGMWVASLLSRLLGAQLPGPGTLYLGQSLEFLRPISMGDEITATLTVVEKITKNNQLVLSCHCVNQHGKAVVTGEIKVEAPLEKIKRLKVILPDSEVETGKPRFFEELLTISKQWKPLRTAIVHPVDESSLGGAIEAAREGIIDPVLVGPEHKIRAIAEQENYDLSGMTLIPTQHSHEAAAVAVAMARRGEVEALMKGNLHTDELMAVVVNKNEGLRTGRRMSHVFALDVPTYHKPLFLTDAAVNIHPNLSAKKDIIQNAIDLFLALNRGVPKVAIVSAVETVNEAIPSTLDATALCKMAERGQITGGILDGPLGFDNAVSKEAAEAKGIFSAVAGDADIIVTPDIESGNMLYKQIRYLSKVEGAGVVLGAKVPIILTSRAAGKGMTRMASCALALFYARATSGEG